MEQTVIYIKDKYEVTDTIAKRYIDATTESKSSNYAMNCRIFTIPRAVLLFDKYNKCRNVEISTKLLCQLYQKAILKHFVNIGQLIFCIDASYSSNNNSILNSSEHVSYTVSVEFLPFVSKNIPSISNLNEYFDNVPKDLFIEDTKTT